MSRIIPLASAVALAGASFGSAAQSASLPASVGSLDKAVTSQAAPHATPVRYWHHHWHGGGGWGYPFAGGIGWGWGWPGYYAGYGAPYYYEPPVYRAAPRVYRVEPPRGANRQCWVDTDSGRGYGYWRPC
jgi:hypothetical protein